MTGGRCHRRRKMMGRGADGGCGMEERTCRPAPRVPSAVPAKQVNDSENIVFFDMDFFVQARKALCEKGPFDATEDGSSSGLGMLTLPSTFASLLKQSDNRKKHRKSHSGAEKKSFRLGEKSRAGSIWVETEEYFRNIALPDIDALSELYSFPSLASKKCFSIPFEGNRPDRSNAHVLSELRDDVHGAPDDLEVGTKRVLDSVDGVVTKEVNSRDEVVKGSQQPGEENICSFSDSSISLESVLGIRSRILYTSERPSKKRKLVSRDAGLDKLVAAFPCNETLPYCDFCCMGETGRYPNKLIVCSSCKIVVHKKCYGVQEDVDESWRCSWCRQKNGNCNLDSLCVFCPKQGGALKPICKNMGSNDPVQYAHLFCSLWAPEVYIEDLLKMEPILNFEGVKETRRKVVCSLCKMKTGFCVGCCNGTCRTSFHPICAREAAQRLEVWGKDGCDTIELRAFCSKHSSFQENRISLRTGNGCMVAGNESSATMDLPSKETEGHNQNGDKMKVDEDTQAPSLDVSGDGRLWETGSPFSETNESISGARKKVQHSELELHQVKSVDKVESDSMSFGILKKLIEKGKVNVDRVAREIGTSPNLLSAKVAEGNFAPDLGSKIAKWIGKHAYLGSLVWKGLKGKTKPGFSRNLESGNYDFSEDVAAPDFGNYDLSEDVDAHPTDSLAQQEMKQSKHKNLRGDKKQCISTMVDSDDELMMNEAKADQSVKEENTVKPDDCQQELKSNPSRLSVMDPPGVSVLKEDASPSENFFSGQGIGSDINLGLLDLIDQKSFAGFYVHPSIREKLLQIHTAMHKRNILLFNGCGTTCHDDGTKEEISRLQMSSKASVCCSHRVQHPDCSNQHDSLETQLSEGGKMEMLQFSPEDELEGELIYHQYQLLGNVLSRKHLSDNLVWKVSENLQHEITVQRQQKWDNVVANQYFRELREARKKGRKEKKHMEAQAVLAAATAAAASSARFSHLRKDGSDEPANQEALMRTSSGRRAGFSSHVVRRANEALSMVLVPRQSSEKQSDVSEIQGEDLQLCDICQRSETVWNHILVCSGCKVAVHLDCYKNVKESTGPWQCEYCEEMHSSRLSRPISVNSWVKSCASTECALCGNTNGAFRKAANGQWVHAFCAEWVLESTFRRGQVDAVRGLETLTTRVATCCICHHNYGACIKCCYGHCQTTFHPICARSAGFYLTGGGKLPHKAYCEKHSVEQKAKAEAQKHGAEEIKTLKQYRVELERLRLLCERIIKREKLKRELVLCSHEILAIRRDHAARFLLRTPFLPPDISSESATTSLKGHQDSYKSGSEAIQRSDDVTVDSALSIKRRNKGLMPMETDHKTDDSATSQNCLAQKTMERSNFGGKTIPRRHALASNLMEDNGRSTKSRKQIETFAKELVMTSDEASMKNRRLPKGYFYVPVDHLQEEKQTDGEELCGRDG